MARKGKQHAYLAVFVGDRASIDFVKLTLWDQLRYDQCFPLYEDRFPAWLVFARPYRTNDYKSEFTLARWESFGYRERDGKLVIGHSPASESLRLPFEMEQEMRALEAAFATRAQRST